MIDGGIILLVIGAVLSCITPLEQGAKRRRDTAAPHAPISTAMPEPSDFVRGILGITEIYDRASRDCPTSHRWRIP